MAGRASNVQSYASHVSTASTYILGEKLDLSFVLGSIMVLMGILLVSGFEPMKGGGREKARPLASEADKGRTG